jgi:hypothetical protein
MTERNKSLKSFLSLMSRWQMRDMTTAELPNIFRDIELPNLTVVDRSSRTYIIFVIMAQILRTENILNRISF